MFSSRSASMPKLLENGKEVEAASESQLRGKM